MNVGQALDRQAVLNDIELLTGKRPAGTRYDERKWSIVLPMELTAAIIALPGVRVGGASTSRRACRRSFSTTRCPVAVVREFLGGVFGADGHAPALHRTTRPSGEDSASLRPPAYLADRQARARRSSSSSECSDLLALLDRCGVRRPREHGSANMPSGDPRRPIPRRGRHSAHRRFGCSSPDGLSFVERVGFRYCVDKEYACERGGGRTGG